MAGQGAKQGKTTKKAPKQGVPKQGVPVKNLTPTVKNLINHHK